MGDEMQAFMAHIEALHEEERETHVRIDQRLGAIELAQERTATLRKASTGVVSLTFAAVLALAAWLVAATLRTEERATHVAQSLSAHQAAPGHQATLDRVGEMSGDIRALTEAVRSGNEAAREDRLEIKARLIRIEERDRRTR